ncbi:MAG: hypothetical protein ACYTGZ_05840 [Planctomycetota bacterium]|jgi:tetratricopeptide (TPR) repeat protein
MQKLGITLLALVAGVGGGLAAHAMQDERPAARAEQPARTDRGAGDREILARLDRMEQRWEERIAGLEAKQVAASFDGAPLAEARAERSTIEVEAKPAEEDPLAEYMEGRFDNDKSNGLFAHLGRNRNRIESTIRKLEAAIKKEPNNPELYVALATAYGAKTAYATQPGPEQGIVWEQAKNAYKGALKIEPNHWQARYGLAFGDSMAPEFVGLRPKAIEQFEELVQIQESGTPREEQALVYMRLGTLYKDAGSVKKARAMWRRGVDRHPGNESLKKALALVTED